MSKTTQPPKFCLLDENSSTRDEASWLLMLVFETLDGWGDSFTFRTGKLRVAKQCLFLQRFQMLNGFHGGHRRNVHPLQFLNHRVFLPLE